MRVDLTSAIWTVEALPGAAQTPVAVMGRALPAAVPGCVHVDLLNAGLIGHPNVGFHEDEIQWIGETDWRYLCRFHAPPELLRFERVELVCEGLDTIAELDLNGRRIGAAANMHHPHRFDARAALRAGENELAIVFRAPRRHVRAEEQRLGARPVNGDWEPYIFIRKAACNFGWDWGPHVATAGVWRGVALHGWNAARIEQARPLVRRVDGEHWIVDAHIALAGSGIESKGEIWLHAALFDETARCVAECAAAARTISGSAEEVVLSLRVAKPALWWPRGHGGQPLYALRVRLEREPATTNAGTAGVGPTSPPTRTSPPGRSREIAGVLTAGLSAPPGEAGSPAGSDVSSEMLDEWTGRIGFRTVRLDTVRDEHGSRFTLEINDRPIFCKGANWIPDGLFPSEMTPARCRERVQQAADANLNMLRVWGGGLYESPAFYEACDELGILVWQDFMFACALYSEEPPLPDLIRKEAEHNVARLSRHPSVALWCGGNECVWAHESWGFKERLKPGQTWGRGYYFDLLPRLVAELDPTRPYWPNSPWSGAPDVHPNDLRHGNQHVWDARDAGYRALAPRFVSEFGHQSPPNYATLREALPESELQTNSAAMRHRQRASGGNATRYDGPLREWFREPRNFDEWHYLAQLLQARAIATGLEWWRANQPRCMGALFWQLNDCWAGHSWSAIDCAGRRKPLWYAVRRSCAPRLLTIQPLDGQPTLVAINETDSEWRGTARVRRMSFDGATLAAGEIALAAGPWGAARAAYMPELVGAPADERNEFLVVDAEGRRATWFYARDRELRYPPPRFQAALSRNERGWRLELRAETLLRDIVIAADRVAGDAQVDDQLITLPPGEACVFRITSQAALSTEQFAAPPVLQCANAFGG